MKAITINTSLCPCIDFTTYDSRLSSVTKEEEYNRDNWHEDFCYTYVSQDSIDEFIVHKAKDYFYLTFCDALKAYGVRCVRVHSVINKPREYNFRHDALLFDVVMTRDWRKKALAFLTREDVQQDEAVINFIANNWKSYDGFNSYMPESVAELAAWFDPRYNVGNLSVCDERDLAVYLTIACLKEGILLGDDWAFGEYGIADDLDSWLNGNDGAKTTYFFTDEWIKLYDDDLAIDVLIHDTYQRAGWLWRDYGRGYCPDYFFDENGEEMSNDEGVRFTPQNDADCFLCWAADNHLSVEDVREIAAGRKHLYSNGNLFEVAA
jgi:hypothetical protein